MDCGPKFDVKVSIPEEKLLKSTDEKKRKPKFVRGVSGYFREFSNNTSIHGFKYLTSGRGCFAEKLWWSVVLCLCIYACVKFIASTLKKREENPVFISFHQAPMHIWDIPFPAVTICPGNRIQETKYNLTHYANKYIRNNLTKEELKHFLDINLFCSIYSCEGSGKLTGAARITNHTVDLATINFLIQQAYSLEDTLDFCFMDKKPCQNSFSPILTTSGLCFTINMLDRSELFNNITYLPKNHGIHSKSAHWQFDNNYDKTLNETVPTRLTSIDDSLFIGLRFHKVDSNMCSSFKGFKLIFHHPAEMPNLSNRFVLLSNDQSYKIWIKPDVITTSPKLKTYYEPSKRGCYFSEERSLKYYQVYTERNCQIECVSNYTFKLCGCISFYTPHETSKKLCGLPEQPCIDRVKDWFKRMDMEMEIFPDQKNQVKKYCGCLPSCTHIRYDTEVTNKKQALDSPRHGLYTIHTIHISYKDVNYVTKERNELFSSADFWASCGGLLSLCTGFSMVSLAEIIYFLTVKWMCNLWKRSRQIW